MRYVDKTITQLTKVGTSRRLKKNWADELRKLDTENIALHLMLTKKLELNLSYSHKSAQMYSNKPRIL